MVRSNTDRILCPERVGVYEGPSLVRVKESSDIPPGSVPSKSIPVMDYTVVCYLDTPPEITTMSGVVVRPDQGFVDTSEFTLREAAQHAGVHSLNHGCICDVLNGNGVQVKSYSVGNKIFDRCQ